MSRPNDGGRRAAGYFGVGMLAVSACVLLSGCDDYLERRDTITLGVGDSVAVNKSTQTINRWPEAARQDRWLSDGERARSAVSRYRSRTVTPPAALDKGSGEDGNSISDKVPSATANQ